MDKYAFNGCSGLTEVSIGNSVTSIGVYAFHDCTSLTEVSIGNSVTSIAKYAFYGCSGLTEISIPNSVTSIGDYAFKGCSRLTEVTIEDGTTTLSLGYNGKLSSEYNGRGLFYDCPLEKLYLGRNLSYYSSSNYGYSPFYYLTTLKSVIIGNSVTSIGDYAFYGCSLTEVTIGNSVTSIGSGAFYDCCMSEISIPNSVTNIGNSAFKRCRSLTEVSIEDGTTTLSLGSNYYSSPSTSYGLFCDCPLEKLYLGRNLSYNSSSSYVYSPFYFKTKLTSLIIGNSVTSIGDYAFNKCSGLTEISIPNSVTEIGNYAFNGCTALGSITCNAVLPPSANNNSFDQNTYAKATLRVPESAVNAYNQHAVWQLFTISDEPLSEITDVVEEEEADGPFDIYNMRGMLIKRDAVADDLKDLSPDIYIIRQGACARKIVVR